ncbi:FxSxx-COOH system tetratricopeptide repeat protein [Parafrankia sp. FMc6]|uniref:FxSxx-COOH system tetratricopeptide repeat protein n=1 Tax=Parafrankia soli TaxID=2599596 RepID=UPI0034D7B98C
MSGTDFGTVVTFYSYKGGTGRSMALANTAWLLASSGCRVLVVDWDLEAPGLHRYFHPFLHDPDLRSTPGIMDMIWEFTVTVMSPQGPDDADWFSRSTAITPYAASLNWPFPDGGTVDFVCSGRHDAAYAQRVGTFDWNAFYADKGGGDFVDALRQDMRSSYEWILIDSRTGLSDTAGICTVQLPDIVVNCFTLSTQSIEGAVAVSRSIAAQKEGREIRQLPVPMRVEDGEQRKLELGRDVARVAFDPFLRGFDERTKEHYWGDVEVPYKPYYAYEEILAVFGDRPLQEGTLLAAYERLASYLTGGAVAALPPQDESRRRRILAVFERSRVSIPTDMVVSHASADRPWAEWVAAELETAGFQVILEQVDQPGAARKDGEEADPIRRTVAIVSAAYLRSAEAMERWRRSLTFDPDGAQRLLVPVRVEEVRMPPEGAARDHADLVGLAEAPARRALVAAAGSPSRLALTARPRPADTTDVRYPGSPPGIWEGVPARNPMFVGRDALLMDMRNRFVGDDKPAAHALVLQGLAGVGKTQVAAEYVFRFGPTYDLVCWIGCDQAALARSDMTRLAHTLGLPVRQGRDPVDSLVDALRKGVPYRRWLLVFDNADTPDEILPLIPNGFGHVVITSRNQRWRGRQSPVEIDVFNREESVELLQRSSPALTTEVATRLAEALGDLPLALEHAGAWHAETGMPAERYLQLLESSPGPLLLEGEVPTYPRPVAMTWLLSMERLRSRAPTSARLAQLCAFFGPEPISLDLFAGDGLAVLADVTDQTLRDDLTLAEAVRQISEHALARVDSRDRSLVMHRLVQTAIRDELTPTERAGVRARVYAILAAADPGNPDDPENWKRYALIRPHLEPTRAPTARGEDVARLVRNQVRCLYMQRDHIGCRDLAGRTLALWRERFGDDDERTLELALDLADSHRALGDAEQARVLDLRARERLIPLLGPNHPLALRAAMALGGDYRGIGDYESAWLLDEDTYARYRETAGLDNPETLKAANNLAVSLRFLGDFKLALEMSEEVYERHRRLPETNDISKLVYLESYARDLRENGRYPASLALLEGSLEWSRLALGDDHPDRLRTMTNYAVSLRWAGQPDRAREIAEDAHMRFRAHADSGQPDALAVAICLVGVLLQVGETAAARRLADETYRRARSRLGDRNIYTLAAANSLVIALRRCGEPAAAEALGQQALDGLRSALSTAHPFTVYCSMNVANCRVDAGRIVAARELDQQAWDLLQAKLGEDHPATLIAAVNLAADEQRGGDPEIAQAQRLGVLRQIGGRLGAEHPVVLALRHGQRVDLDIDPPPF